MSSSVDLDVFERDRRRVGGVQPHLVLDLLRLVAGLVGVDHEARDPLVAELGIGLREDQRHLRVAGHRDPHLRAVEHPAASVLRARVFWLAASEPVSGSVSPKQPSHSPEQSLGRYLLLLLLGAPLQDPRADERGLHRDDGADRRVAAPDLLDDQAVGEVVEACAAVLASGRSRPGSPGRRPSRPSPGRSGGCARFRATAPRSLCR